MYRMTILALLALGCSAQQYGSYGAVKSAPMQTQSYAAPQQVQSYAAPAPVQQAQNYGPIDAAIQTRRTFELRTVAVPATYSQPQIIEVHGDHLPVQIHFKSSSSPLTVQQSHTPGVVGPVEHTSFQDQPHRLVNEVVKPVIQEVREIIQPYRRVTQEIRPVIEEIHTVVHKGEARRIAAPLPMAIKSAGYGAGAALAANTGYKAAKAKA